MRGAITQGLFQDKLSFSIINSVYKAVVTVLDCRIMLGLKIHRYIFREVLSPTLLSLVIFTLVMVMGRAVTLADLIIHKGVAPTDILMLLITLLPTFLSTSLPLAFLMGIMIGFGRLSADGETVAFKASGFGLARISVPVFALALVFVLLAGMTTLWLRPWGFNAFATRSFLIARQNATISFQPQVFIKQFNGMVLYANAAGDRNGQLRGIFVVEDHPGETSWVFADSGNIVTDEQAETVTIRLRDGVIQRQRDADVGNLQLIHFRNYDIQPEITAGNEPVLRSQKPKEMATGQLWRDISNERSPRKRQGLQAELHDRMSAPLAPLLFALFGLPFCIQAHRSGRSGGFVMGLIIFIGYYFIQSTAFTLTKDAATPPMLSYWLPQSLLALSGLFLMRRSSLETPNRFSAWLDQSLLTLQKWASKNVDT
jgi:lipopolysaccharide export system permease protein